MQRNRSERFLTLRWKFSYIIVSVVVAMGILCLVFLSLLNKALREEHRGQGLAIAHNLAANAVDPILVDNRVKLVSLLIGAKAENDEIVYIFATDDHGDVIAHTFLHAFPLDLLHTIVDVGDNAKDAFRRLDTEEGIVDDFAAPILGGQIGTLHLGWSERLIEEEYAEARNAFLWIAFIFLGFVVIASHEFGMRLLARPLARMAAVVDEFGKGDLDARIEVTSNDELGKFSQTLNDIADELQKSINEREEARGLLQKAHDELEERVRERTVQLDATNRELEAFAYSVSHDLRAPLRGIDGFSLALMEEYGDVLDDTGKDYLQRVRKGCSRMGRLIDDLLKLSRLTRVEMKRESIDLSEMARSLLTELRESAPERVVETVVAPGIFVTADPSLVRAAMANLLDNAWKFTRKVPEARIEFGMYRKDGFPVYYVRDNGAGFDMRYAQKLFGAFQRLHTDAEFEGTGIGLATVQRIVHRHGGRIWAEGEVDRGATIHFTLEGGRG